MGEGQLTKALKRSLVEDVRSLFNDRERGEHPVVRRPDGLFGPHSVTWRVHGDVTAMMVGGIAALLLQMLHPAVLAGVWDHSDFHRDMAARLRATARFIALTTYGGREEAEAAIARVRAIHDRVQGSLPDGAAYAANDPRLLAWVHVAETTSFLAAWRRYGEQLLSPAERDRYFAEMAQIGQALGAGPLPRSRAEAAGLIRAMRGELRSDDRTRKLAHAVLSQRARKLSLAPFHVLTVQAAIDLLPDWAQRMHGLHGPSLPSPLVRMVTVGVAEAVRWAFR
jgi:uncharacterized protein (DUF2236 family)